MNTLNLEQVERIAIDFESFNIHPESKETLEKSFSFLESFAANKIIYGINTGFGPMAQFKVENSELNQLQYNLIRSHSSGLGSVFSEEYIRAIVLARMNNFLQGNSGISFGVVEKLIELLNHRINPEIFLHGGVGASGDLVQLAHLALNLIGEGYVYENGVRHKTQELFAKKGIQPLQLKLRDGLGLMNGTSCMTGVGALNIIYSKRLLKWSVASSAMINELVEAYDDSFSVGLNKVKNHRGQQAIASEMRSFLSTSSLIRKREELFQNDELLVQVKFAKKIQEYYSIRCVPQILGPVFDTLVYAQEVIENELNSTNDNPVVSIEEQNVFHGGNFHGDYISLEMDKVKMVVAKMTMLAERQLNFMVNRKLNGKFPAFLNAGKLGFNFGIQGMQFTATSTTAESQMLSNPMYVHSIPNNNDNQDIVSMGTNSASICKQVIDNGFQVMAIHMIAVCQAIDLLPENERKQLGNQTMEVYRLIRTQCAKIEEDIPSFETTALVVELLKKTTLSL